MVEAVMEDGAEYGASKSQRCIFHPAGWSPSSQYTPGLLTKVSNCGRQTGRRQRRLEFVAINHCNFVRCPPSNEVESRLDARRYSSSSTCFSQPGSSIALGSKCAPILARKMRVCAAKRRSYSKLRQGLPTIIQVERTNPSRRVLVI